MLRDVLDFHQSVDTLQGCRWHSGAYIATRLSTYELLWTNRSLLEHNEKAISPSIRIFRYADRRPDLFVMGYARKVASFNGIKGWRDELICWVPFQSGSS